MTRVISISTLALFVAASAFAAQSQSMNQSQNQQPGTAMTQMGNDIVLNQIHYINQKEIQLSKMALDKTQSQEVKTLANRMISDHQSLDNKVQSLAQSLNVNLESFQPSTWEKVAMNDLQKLSGNQFDRAYTRSMAMGHNQATQELQMARNEVKDQKIRDLIDSAMPTLHQHRQVALRTEQQLMSQAGTAGNDQVNQNQTQSSGQ